MSCSEQVVYKLGVLSMKQVSYHSVFFFLANVLSVEKHTMVFSFNSRNDNIRMLLSGIRAFSYTRYIYI